MGFPTGAGHAMSFVIGPRGAGPDRIHPNDRGANGDTGPRGSDLIVERIRAMPAPRSSIASLYEGDIVGRTSVNWTRNSIADVYDETFPRERTIDEFLHIAQERIKQSPVRELTLTVPEIQEMTMLGISPRDIEKWSLAHLDALEETRKQAEPITVETMKAVAERISYAEIYDVYRHREETEGDRLLDVTDRALTLDQACAKLIGLAGYDAMEAKEHGLDQFDGGSISELCDRLEELTGDTYSFSNFETPLE